MSFLLFPRKLAVKIEFSISGRPQDNLREGSTQRKAASFWKFYHSRTRWIAGMRTTSRECVSNPPLCCVITVLCAHLRERRGPS